MQRYIKDSPRPSLALAAWSHAAACPSYSRGIILPARLHSASSNPPSPHLPCKHVQLHASADIRRTNSRAVILPASHVHTGCIAGVA